MVLALAWLLAQARHRRQRRLPVAEPTYHEVTISGDALGDALSDDLDAVAGVRRARARLCGTRAHPEAQIDLTLGPAGVPAHVLNDVPGATERVRRSTGWDELPTRVRLTVARHGPHRAE
jgi:hypothetical protein